MYLHKEGKIAECTIDYADSTGARYTISHRTDAKFDGFVWIPAGEWPDDCFQKRDDALQAAMDYHETEGCKLYLELYPAPNKGEWKWIAQDYSGKWWGYKGKPVIRESETVWTELKGQMSDNPISQSPPNPFWRKTLR